jgi:hypothetical protein
MFKFEKAEVGSAVDLNWRVHRILEVVEESKWIKVIIILTIIYMLTLVRQIVSHT